TTSPSDGNTTREPSEDLCRIKKEPGHATPDTSIQDFLTRLQSEDSIERLEEAVKAAAHVLNDIKTPLNLVATETQAANLLERITSLQSQVDPGSTIIGLLGGTGA